MRFALAQVRSTPDPRHNLLLVGDHVRRAAEGGADVVVFPEATMCSFLGDPAKIAEPPDGPWATRVRDLASRFGLTVVVGMFTATAGRRIRNTLLVTGGAEARYDKIHLFDALGQRESERVAPGEMIVTADVTQCVLGLAVCYDIRFPTQFLDLANRGATIMVVCASWAPGPGKLHQWRTLVTARAMDSTSFVVAVDQAAVTGDDGAAPTGIGHSMVVDPAGRVVRELAEATQLAFVDIDPSLVEDVRAALPVLAAR